MVYTHIPIEGPANNASDYYNRKECHSVILQGTVDHEGVFIHINTGWPGRVHVACVFSNTRLYSKERGEIFSIIVSRRHYIVVYLFREF